MNREEIIKRCGENRRNINYMNTNCAPEIWIKNNLRVNKQILSEIIDKLEDPGDGEIIDNPKPDWMPLMVAEIVDLPFNVERDYTWAELEDLIITLSLAGCDAIRFFATGWEPHIEPFGKMSVSGEYSFLKPTDKWDDMLKNFVKLLHKYHMRAYVDLYDHCSHKATWNPFTTKRHNFSYYFYGYGIAETIFMRNHWDDRIMDCLEPERDIVSLGNELRSHVEDDVSERKVWAEKWGVARAKHIFDRGFKQPIPFSGSEETAHKLHGFISAEEHGRDAEPHGDFPCEDYGWTYKTSCLQVHGLGLPEHVDNWAKGGISQRRMFSYSDDGVGTNWWNKIPEDKQGYCEIRKDGSEYACTANLDTRIATVKQFISKLKDRSHCHSIGFLPRSILYKGKTVLSRFDKEVDAGIYTKIAADLWEVDIKRKWSTA